MRCAAALRSPARSALALTASIVAGVPSIAVLADQRVDILIFAKLIYARRKDDQLRTVGQCHACTVDSLVAQPCAVKLMRIKINDGLLDGCLRRLEVHFPTQFGGAVKPLDIVADKKAAERQPSVAAVGYLSKDGGEGIMNSGSNTALRRARKARST